MPQFIEKEAIAIKVAKALADGLNSLPITAEQHALDNPGHVITVKAIHDPELDGLTLKMECKFIPCHWWDAQAVFKY